MVKISNIFWISECFYLLDYVTPTEIFQIGDCKKKKKKKKITWTLFIVIFV